MTALGLGDIERVPVRRPAGPAAGHATACTLLEELGALEPADGPVRYADRRRAPPRPRCRVDPRLGRMVLEADRARLPARGARHRRRAVDPGPARAAGRQAAGRRREARPVRRPGVRLRRLPQAVELPAGAAGRAVVAAQFRRLCQREFLNYLRIREWQDVHGQLRQIARSTRASASTRSRPTRSASTARCSPGCCRTSG